MFQQLPFRCFQCNAKEDSNRFDLNSGGYIKHKEPNDGRFTDNYSDDNDEIYTLFGRCYAESVWLSDIHTLFLFARKGFMQLEQAAIKETSHESVNYSDIRKHICELWLASRYFVTRSNDQTNAISKQVLPSLKKVLIGVKRLQKLPDYILFNSAKRSYNIDYHASYNFLHLCLDIFWLTLTLEHHVAEDPVRKVEIFESNLNVLLTDLIHVAIRAFERMNHYGELWNCSPFLCTCFKELWLLIQLYVEQQSFCKDFWHYFNSAIEHVTKLQCCTNGKVAVQCLWLLYHVAGIQGYDLSGIYVGSDNDRVVSNYTLAEQCVKIITGPGSGQVDESLMCSCLRLLGSLQISWWTRDATFDMLQLLWEYFYKRLDSVGGSQASSFVVQSQTPCDFIALAESILCYDFSGSVAVSSYDMFLCMLGNYIQANPAYWQKLKGRIYSKLSAPKLAAFSDNGLQNLIQLFFVLARVLNFDELTNKLQSLMSQLPVARAEWSLIVWCAHMSVLTMRAQRSLAQHDSVPDAGISAPICVAVQSVSSDRTSAHLMRVYIDGVQNLVDTDTIWQCQGHILFGTWLSRYLQWCSHSDASHLLDILMTVVEKVRALGVPQAWWTMLETCVVPAVHQLAATPDAPHKVAHLAASLVSADVLRFKELLEHMTGDTLPVDLATKFLKHFLEDNLNSLEQFSNHQSVLIQAWVRIALLTAHKADLLELTQLMSHLPHWLDTVGCFDIQSTEDPLYAVIRLAGGRVRSAQTIPEIATVKRWFETYFGRMDKWVAPVMLAAEKGGDSQLVLGLYTHAALLFLHCASALYIKNRSTCLFYRLTSTLLLPSAVLMNKRPANVILAAVSKTWHLFVRGTVQLDYTVDTYIARILKDLVTRYVPHLHESTSPIIRCLDAEFDDKDTSFVLDKIANTFLACKSKTSHEFSKQALKLTLEMFRYRAANRAKFELLMQTVLPPVLEQCMFIENVGNKQLAVQIIECMRLSPKFVELRALFVTAVAGVIKKHLAFYSSSVFRLIEALVPLLPGEMKGTVPHLRETIHKVECQRGVGYDNALRKGLQRIEEIVQHQ